MSICEIFIKKFLVTDQNVNNGSNAIFGQLFLPKFGINKLGLVIELELGTLDQIRMTE